MATKRGESCRLLVIFGAEVFQLDRFGALIGLRQPNAHHAALIVEDYAGRL
jgi:hypothetical protein